DPEGGEVLAREEAALGRVIPRDRGRDVALIEGLARGREPGAPARPSGRAILVRQVSEGPAEIGLDEPLPGARWPATRQVDRRRGGPAAVGVRIGLDDSRDEPPEGEAVPGELDGRLSHPGESGMAAPPRGR